MLSPQLVECPLFVSEQARQPFQHRRTPLAQLRRGYPPFAGYLSDRLVAAQRVQRRLGLIEKDGD